MNLTKTPKPPYYAVIFTSLKSENTEGYDEMNDNLEDLVKGEKGYLGHDSVTNGIGITVSYWDSLESIANWKKKKEHRFAQIYGMRSWYKHYCVRICKIERDYGKW